jgi:hypothetical protein
MSDSYDILMVDFARLSNGCGMAPAGCRRFGSEVRAMIVSALLRFFGGGTLDVCIVLSPRALSCCRTAYWLFKSSSSILDDKIDSPSSSHWYLQISRSVLLSSCINRIIARSLAISNTRLKGWVGSSNI